MTKKYAWSAPQLDCKKGVRGGRTKGALLWHLLWSTQGLWSPISM